MGQAMTCADGSAYLANFGCDDGSVPTCSAGYTLGNTGPGGSYSCVNNSGGSLFVGTPAPSATGSICPVGQTCSIIGSVPDTWIYIGGSALFALLLMKALKK